MDIETYLNAMELARIDIEAEALVIHSPSLVTHFDKRHRQYRAFRARILRMYRERDDQASKSFDLWVTERRIANDLRRQLGVKDGRIAELEELLSLVNDYRQDRLVTDRKKVFKLAKELDA